LTSADKASVRRAGSHAVVFKGAGRVQPFVLQEERVGAFADELSDAVVALKDRLPFADRNALFERGERQQFVESPHAAVSERISAFSPILFKALQRFRNGQFVPVVVDVEERAALRAAMQNFGDVKGCLALGIDTALKCVHNYWRS
jgi:hypothetical protein